MIKPVFKKNGSINSAVLWQGKSQLDGAPIALIAIVNSSNRKTGGMLQTYIIRTDVPPIEANRTGADYSICGDCHLRGKADSTKETGLASERGCYVNLGQGPTIVYKTFDKSGYPRLVDCYGPIYSNMNHDQLLTTYGADQNIRCGTYGDPLAVPQWVWDALLKRARNWTGYTHQFNRIDSDALKVKASRFNMISADTLKEAREHWRNGLRTFRTVINTADIDPANEIVCPATKEGGERTTCEFCNLCAGSSIKAKNIVAVVHGSGAKYASANIIAKG
jgi:hypothetical protein